MPRRKDISNWRVVTCICNWRIFTETVHSARRVCRVAKMKLIANIAFLHCCRRLCNQSEAAYFVLEYRRTAQTIHMHNWQQHNLKNRHKWQAPSDGQIWKTHELPLFLSLFMFPMDRFCAEETRTYGTVYCNCLWGDCRNLTGGLLVDELYFWKMVNCAYSAIYPEAIIRITCKIPYCSNTSEIPNGNKIRPFEWLFS